MVRSVSGLPVDGCSSNNTVQETLS
jgi:hypothetical protein